MDAMGLSNPKPPSTVSIPRVCCPSISQEVMAQPKREARKNTRRFFTHGDQGFFTITSLYLGVSENRGKTPHFTPQNDHF